MQKVKIVQNINHKIALDDIASVFGKDFDELLDKLSKDYPEENIWPGRIEFLSEKAN